MEYEIIEVQGIDGVEEHVVIQMPDGGKLTFPAVETNPNYKQFKLNIAEEQK
jgi:hypothetical protein